MDITEIILTQHHEQRRMFAMLDDLRDQDPSVFGPVWDQLAILLEAHAAAEEEYFYPKVLAVGVGNADADSAEEETEDAIGDHNDIRDAVARAGDHEVGSDDWWKAVTEARIANDDHMAEEERQDLADIRRHASLQERHDIAVQFISYMAKHATGVKPHDLDPKEYIKQHS